MNDLDLLIEQPKELRLCGKKIIVKEMVAGKALEVVELYQKANTILIKAIDTKNPDIKKSEKLIFKTKLMKKYQDAVIDVCLQIIKPKFSLKNIKIYKEYSFLNRKWLYTNATIKQLESFIKIVLYPILGDEALKKIQAVEQILKK